ncbi:MAG: 3-deoxy-8-phosphooctulonate synthase [Bacteroidota bacterium]
MSNLFLLSGPCAIEERDMALRIAEAVKGITEKLGITYIFKGSYKKANRTRLDSFTGIDKEDALKILVEVREQFEIPVITDVHESYECAHVAEYVDYLQIPAFLCRQTDLLLAAGKTGKGLNIKKGQFLSPEAMRFARDKVASTGNENIWLTERGTTFGYESLVVDMTSIPRMQAFGGKVVMDCTHSVQRPNQTSGITGGDANMIRTMCHSAVAAGADGLFIETHPAPHTAKSDAASMLQMDLLEGILTTAVRIRESMSEKV